MPGASIPADQTGPAFRAELRVAGRVLDLTRPALMGVVNANPDSFSDPGHRSTASQLEQIRTMVADGAAIIDIGGQSGITTVAEVDPDEEIRRVLPLVVAVALELPDTIISVDTYKPAVVAAVLDAGAHIINDVSGLRAPDLAPMVADRHAALVVMHTAAAPKQRLQATDLYGDIVAEVGAFLTAKVGEAVAAGVDERSILVDLGPDFAKTPAQTIELLRHVDDVNPTRLPMLLAVSRKDFVGALTGTRPTERLAGTLAVIAAVGTGPGRVLRVHDVAEVRRFVTVLDALTGDEDIDPELRLGDDLRWAAGRPDGTRPERG